MGKFYASAVTATHFVFITNVVAQAYALHNRDSAIRKRYCKEESQQTDVRQVYQLRSQLFVMLTLGWMWVTTAVDLKAYLMREINMSKPLVSWFALWSVILGTLVLGACTPPKPSASGPTIEASPLGKEIGNWKVVASDALTLTGMAPGATQVKLIYKPVTAAKRHLEMATLTASTAGRKLPLTEAAELKPEA